MKTILFTSLLFLAGAVVLYLLGAFIGLKLDPRDWHILSRSLLGCCLIIWAIVIMTNHPGYGENGEGLYDDRYDHLLQLLGPAFVLVLGLIFFGARYYRHDRALAQGVIDSTQRANARLTFLADSLGNRSWRLEYEKLYYYRELVRLDSAKYTDYSPYIRVSAYYPVHD